MELYILKYLYNYFIMHNIEYFFLNKRNQTIHDEKSFFSGGLEYSGSVSVFIRFFLFFKKIIFISKFIVKIIKITHCQVILTRLGKGSLDNGNILGNWTKIFFLKGEIPLSFYLKNSLQNA
jgi:hypothetical protein